MPLDVPPIVLLVDDHRDALEQYSESLEAAGFWVATSAVPAEAISAIDDLNPDVLVVDADSTGDTTPSSMPSVTGRRPGGCRSSCSARSSETTAPTPS